MIGQEWEWKGIFMQEIPGCLIMKFFQINYQRSSALKKMK